MYGYEKGNINFERILIHKNDVFISRCNFLQKHFVFFEGLDIFTFVKPSKSQKIIKTNFMKKHLLLTVLCLVSIAVWAQQTGDNLNVQKFVLDNGLTVLLNEDHSEPKVYGAVVVKVGSKNDPEHATGMAHYFEHIMFKGTDSIGTLDFAAEKVYLDSISMLYDVLNQTTDKNARQKLQIHINELSIKASEYAIPNEVDKLLKKYGGTQVNAFTSLDITAYHNVFPPNQLEKWMNIYAERFRNPIFRLFQSELETVYEERNMGADRMGGKMQENLLKTLFKKHPYHNPVVGTVEDLKNPSISRMVQFYQDYYVANNMALILVGDFEVEKILPLIREKFGLWRSGEVPVFPVEKYKEDPFAVNETVTGRYLPIKLEMLAYRGVPHRHPDEVGLDLCCRILSNSGTGLLDGLRNENKLMEVFATPMQLNDEGLITFFIIPKLIGGSLPKTEKLVLQYIDSLKQGNFSDELLHSIKIDQKRSILQSMENPMSRAYSLLSAYAAGYTWEEYVAKNDRFLNMTKEEIVTIANRYFTDHHLAFRNKTGFSSKAEKITKPPYKPVLPRNTEKESEFAKRLDNMPDAKNDPIFVDLKKDFRYEDIRDKVHLITGDNPLNPVFSLKITYGVGTRKDSLLQLVSHLSELGTENKSLKEFKQALQNIGAELWTESNSTETSLNISGFDEYFDQTLELLHEWLTAAKADDKQMSKLVEDAKAGQKMEKQDQNTLDDALCQYALYGKKSEYIDRLTANEIKKIRSADILTSFQKIKNYETTITYVGTLPLENVKSALIQHIGFPDSLAVKDLYIRPRSEFSKNKILICDNPKANQSAVNVYIPGEKNSDTERLQASLFNQYFGLGMSSILFQEIREFRSLSYSAYGSYKTASKLYPDFKGYFMGVLSCQSDKTNEAIDILNQLICDMPRKPERLATIRQAVLESINNSKPGFRAIPSYGYSLVEQGYTEDYRKTNLDYTQISQFNDIENFYQDFIQNRPTVYIITGNKKKMDLKALEKYGEIQEVKAEQLFKN